MCRLKSGIALRDRLYIPDHDSHEDMLKELGIKDDYMGASKTFVRWELVPPYGNMLADVNTWALSVDQDIVPDWWDEDARKPGIVGAVKVWAAEHIMVSGEKEVDHGIYYLFGDAKITLRGNSKATLWGNSQAELFGNSKATLWGNSKATLFGNSKATLWGNSKATLWGNSQAELCGNSHATLFGNSKATLRGNSQAMLRGNSKATLCGNSQAELWGNSHATLRGNSQAMLRGNSKATLWDDSQATLWGNSQATLRDDSMATPDQCIIHDNAILICYKDHTIMASRDWQVMKV